MDEPLFRSVHDAATFALEFATKATIARPTMNKMMAPPTGSGGKGLVGVDGAAQAGMIRSEIAKLGEMEEACVIARVAPHFVHCYCQSPCCSGHYPNMEWRTAITTAATQVRSMIELAREDGKRGMKDDPMLRRMLVEKYFGIKLKAKEIAESCEVSDMTVVNHNEKIVRILRKSEKAAWDNLDSLLRRVGILEK